MAQNWLEMKEKYRMHLPDYSASLGFAQFRLELEMWKLNHKKGWAPKNWCFWTMVLEKTLESPLDSNETKPVNPKGNQLWIFIGRTDAEAPILWPHDEYPTHWKRPWCWERLKAGGEGDDRGWDGWMASLTQWTGVWASSGRWWMTRKSGMFQTMGLQRVGWDWTRTTKN